MRVEKKNVFLFTALILKLLQIRLCAAPQRPLVLVCRPKRLKVAKGTWPGEGEHLSGLHFVTSKKVSESMINPSKSYLDTCLERSLMKEGRRGESVWILWEDKGLVDSWYLSQ